MLKPDKRIPLVECFGPTIQGEGSMIGQQTYFLRFGLCDYFCDMCDSLHAVLPNLVRQHGSWLTQDEIFDTLTNNRSNKSTSWVTFSGGNPCIHDLTRLVDLLLDSFWQIAVETQGTFSPNWLDCCHVITVSPKSPGMGEDFEEVKFFDFVSRFHNHPGLSVKIVVFNREDANFAANVFLGCIEQGLRTSQLFLSQGNPFPPRVKEAPENHIEVLRREYIELFDYTKTNAVLSKVKFLPQLHVWTWGNKQGV